MFVYPMTKIVLNGIVVTNITIFFLKCQEKIKYFYKKLNIDYYAEDFFYKIAAATLI